MPTTVIDARVTIQEDNKVWLELSSGDKTLEMTAFTTMTLEEIAALIINQDMPPDVNKTLQKRYLIEWHVGAEGERIVDDVTSEQLPDEAAQEGYENLPGWATWTAQEAADWIDANVTDLASAKIALAAMAKAITYLRDWRH